MKDLTNEQKEFIDMQSEEYRNFENRLNELKNEAELLYEEKQIKCREYEKAKEELDSLIREINHDQEFLDNSMVRYVNKKEIRYVFTTLAKSYGVFFALNLVLTLAGVIEILNISDLLTYFFCAPGLMGTTLIVVSSFFLYKKREQLTKEFHNLDESVKLHEIIDRKKEEAKEKKRIFEEKKTAFRDVKNQTKQIEFKIGSVKHAMDQIKTNIFETIYSNDDVIYTSDMILQRKK